MRIGLQVGPYVEFRVGALFNRPVADDGGEVTLTSIVVSPDTATVNAAATQQFTATGHYSDASTADITADVTWDTSDHAKATISAAGLLTGVAEGTCTVSATLGAVNDSSSTITIAAVLTSITVTAGAGLTFKPTASGDRLQMTATGHYTGKADTDITTSVTWGSGTTSVATISNAGGTEGQVAAVAGAITSSAAATSLITATVGAVSGNATVTVDTDVDATAGWRLPVNAYQWSLMGETPSSLYLMTEASGNLADAIGSVTLTATSLLYNQAIAGLTRTGIALNATTDKAIAAAGVGPNPSTTSVLDIIVVLVDAAGPAAARDFVFCSDGATSFSVQHTTTDKVRTFINAVATNGASDPGGLRLLALHYDRANSAANAYTDQEKVVGTYAAGVVDGNKGVGDGPGTASNAIKYAYRAVISGAAAERTTGSCKTLFEKMLKASVSWS